MGRVHYLFDDDRDPMEEAGMSYCADCGMYPLAPGEDHNCQP